MLNWSGRRPFPSQVRTMPLQLPATEEARSTHWSSADGPSVPRLASPHPPIEFRGLRLRPGHTLPTATRSHSHVCPALPFERSSAESSARRSTAKCVGAAHLSDIVVRSPHLRGQPSTFRRPAEIGETLGENCRYLQPFVSKAGWQASTQTYLHLSRAARAMVFLPRRSCPRKPRAVSTSRTSVLSETPL